MSEAPSIDDLLVMATSLHGSSREVINGKRAPTANGWPILKQVLVWLGKWNAQTHQSLYGDQHHPDVDCLYESLIALTNQPADSSLVVGYGNLGTATSPPSWPTYVAFGVSRRGLTIAEELFSQFGEFTSFKNGDDPLP